MMEHMKKYAEKFGDGFPMFQIGRSRTDEEIVEIIKECIEKGKDAYELGYVTDDPDVLY